jgi:hypothetical protein
VSLNANAISGTLPLNALPATVVLNGESGVTLTGSFTGNGGGLTGLNADGVTAGTLPLSVLPAAVVTNNEASASFGSLNLSGTLNLPATTPEAGFITIGGIPVLHTYGNENVFAGGAGNFTVTGSQNVGIGSAALASNTTGGGNTANGVGALFSNTNGNNNIALGTFAGANLTTGDNNIDIGNGGVDGDSGTMRIGTPFEHTNAYIAGIWGVTLPYGVAVYVNPAGQLGTLTSSARFKQDIRKMGEASESLLALQPVTFHYKTEIDPRGTPQFGLVAEEVEKVDPALVARDVEGRPYSVRYEAVNAMLLNEFIKQHHKVTEQAAEIADLKERLEALEALVCARAQTGAK